MYLMSVLKRRLSVGTDLLLLLLIINVSVMHVPCVYLNLCLFTLHNFTVTIPSAEEIKAARRQRRTARTQKEFISMRGDGQSSAGSTPDHYSREDEDDRVDGDDDDDEPDDHEKRIEFAPRLKSIRERIVEKLGMSEREERVEG